MPIEYQETGPVFRGLVGVEDAETLLEWLQQRPSATADLSQCEHLHPANLQVLLAANIAVQAWPKDAGLKGWLRSAFDIHSHGE
ncbi:hypothetical protein LNV23_00800 [Paucibacter sp. DJ1R-11]|uniref:hypothetical protein n=1 Tax=Paucibacter sp. DJ1R-11 TaxID=2893556 RepID=UPI0021E4B7C5|nr:hypothetical protein [Paucibacter sp. DJ1R-11]MCV2361983.1 hypothetical protein [Paucibacter sp. DJ1R-11]